MDKNKERQGNTEQTMIRLVRLNENQVRKTETKGTRETHGYKEVNTGTWLCEPNGPKSPKKGINMVQTMTL